MKIILKYLGPINERRPLSFIFVLFVFLICILMMIKRLVHVAKSIPLISDINWPRMDYISNIYDILILLLILILALVIIWQIYSVFSSVYADYQIKTFNLRGNLQVDPGKIKNISSDAPYKLTPDDRINKYIRHLVIYPYSNYLIVKIPLPIIYAESMADKMNERFKSNNNYDSLNKFFSNNFSHYYIRFHHYNLGSHNRFMYWRFPHK